MRKSPCSIQLTVILTCCLAVCLSAAPLRAQAPAAETAPAPRYTGAALDQLLGPIALYPDPMIALILPASTTPSDVVLAARYTASKGDPDKVADKPWDDSVKALVHYPDVLAYMDKNLDWTTDLGEAFVAQPSDVMNSIQQLRARAQAAGNLKDTPQQTVVVKEEKVIIMPAEPKVIYVPQYDPAVVYVASPVPPVTPLITFGLGLAVGAWMNHDCDWYHHGIYVGPWNPGYGWGNRPVYHNEYNNKTTVNINNNNKNNWNHNGNNNGNNNGGMWKPNPSRPGSNRPGGNDGNRPSQPGNGNNIGNRPSQPGNGNNGNRPGNNNGNRPATLPSNVPSTNRPDVSQRPGAGSKPSTKPAQRPGNDAFSGYGQGASTRDASQRGQSSRQQASPKARSGGGSGGRQSGGGGGGGGGGKRGGR